MARRHISLLLLSFYQAFALAFRHKDPHICSFFTHLLANRALSRMNLFQNIKVSKLFAGPKFARIYFTIFINANTL